MRPLTTWLASAWPLRWVLAVLAGTLLWLPGLSFVNRQFYDAGLFWLGKFRLPVDNRIAHFDIGQSDLDGWIGTKGLLDGLADLIHELRNQGASVIALDLLLPAGNAKDYEHFWRQAGMSPTVLAYSWDDRPAVPAGIQLPQGLVYLSSDPDGVMRSYRWAYTNPNSPSELGPSLALATFLTMHHQAWTPRLINPDGSLQLEQRCLPGEVLYDQRAGWNQETGNNMWHFNSKMLARWKVEPAANPRLEGRVVLVGAVGEGSGDQAASPLDANLPKVAVHALALNDLIQDSWRSWAPRWAMGLGSLLLAWSGASLGRRSGWLPLGVVGAALIPLSALGAMRASHWVAWTAQLELSWLLGLALQRWRQNRLHQWRNQAIRASADMDDPMVMKSVGRYVIVDRLGQGGFGTVYRGLDQATLLSESAVAIKVAHLGAAQNKDFRRRFLREIRISAQLKHPHIVEVLDSGEQNGMLFLAMELVPGQPLRAWLEQSQGQPWTVERTRAVLSALGQGLIHAHRHNVVHRDLKPENIMVDGTEGQLKSLKILDFGLAFDSQSSKLTQSGELFGTLDYLAPERIQGVNDDPRSDQYAVGVIAYEMLAGKNPFPPQTNAGETILFRLTQDPKGLAELRPDLPAPLVAAVTRMMARDPQARFPDVEAAMRELL